jgi:hypothetical protein
MKSSNLKIAQLATLGSLFAIVGAGCNGGSSTKLVVVTNPAPAPTATATPIGPEPGPTTDPTPAPTFTAHPIGPEPYRPSPISSGGSITFCPSWGCNGPPIIQDPLVPLSGGTDVSDSTPSDTRDTDLQQANLQSATLANRAQTLSTQFQMSIGAATQLAVLGDKVQLMTSQGQELSDDDRDAITQSALSIAGISSDEVNQAFRQSVSGDNTATDALVEKAAKNLGMTSSENLKGQLLQALGVQLQ